MDVDCTSYAYTLSATGQRSQVLETTPALTRTVAYGNEEVFAPLIRNGVSSGMFKGAPNMDGFFAFAGFEGGYLGVMSKQHAWFAPASCPVVLWHQDILVRFDSIFAMIETEVNWRALDPDSAAWEENKDEIWTRFNPIAAAAFGSEG